MEQSSEVKNNNIETTTILIGEQNIRSMIQTVSVKQEDVDSIDTELSTHFIKIEPKEHENEFQDTAGISQEKEPKYDVKIEPKIEPDEPMIKVEYDDPVEEITDDPLDISCLMEAEQHFPTKDDESTNKTGENKIKENYLRNNSSEFSILGQLLGKDESNCQNKKHTCPICNKKYTRKSYLNGHIRHMHCGEKPFTCNVCFKTFSERFILNKHMQSHSEEKPYLCDICEKGFRTQYYLDLHKLTHTDVKPYSCDECDKTFRQKAHLVSHKKLHTGLKPYICDLCDKAFAQEGNLNTHKRTHFDDRPFSCEICDYSFTRKSSYTKHKQLHKTDVLVE